LTENEEQAHVYATGDIVSYSWGYEQTNIDFYKVIARKGDFCTLRKLKANCTHDAQTMTGTTTPKEEFADEKTIRRKVHRRDGKESGFAIQSYGWASLWDGQPEHYSTYG
jgi:hypothetical protein